MPPPKPLTLSEVHQYSLTMTRLAAEIGQTFNDILPHCPQDVRKEVDFALEGVKKFYWHMARLEYACRGRGCEDVGDTL